MKSRTLYGLILLAFVLLAGLMFVHLPNTPNLPVKDIPLLAAAPPVKAPAISAPEPAAMPAATSLPPTPASAPTKNNGYQMLAAPGTFEITIPGSVGEAAIPAALAIKDSDPDLSPEQQQRITWIMQGFMKQINSAGADPTDPDYLNRWRKAQADADANLRLVIGQEAFLRYSETAGQISMSTSQ